MGTTELGSGLMAEEAVFDGRTPSLAPAVDITFSKPSAVFKSSKAGLRFRKLKERGQSLLSRSNSSSNRKTGRSDRILSSQNDSSATALPSHAADPRSSAAAAAATARSAVPVATQNKGATEFRVRGMRDADTAHVGSPSPTSNSPHNRRASVDDAIHATTFSVPPQRRTKLVRNPRNTRHMRNTHNSLFTQSMDIDRSQALDASSQRRSGVFTQLFACCTPISLFRRTTSYGSMRNEARNGMQSPSPQDHSHLEQQSQQQTRQAPQLEPIQQHYLEDDDDVDEEFLREQLGHGNDRILPTPGLLGHGRLSATDTAVGADSMDEHSGANSKASTTPEGVLRSVGAADEADENDWLMSHQGDELAGSMPVPVSVVSGRDGYPVSSRHNSTATSTAPVSSSRPAAVSSSSSSGISSVAPPRFVSSGSSGLYIAPRTSSTPQNSEYGAYNSTYSDLDTEAGVSSMGNSVYRTPPTSVGGYTSSSAGALRDTSSGAHDGSTHSYSHDSAGHDIHHQVDVELGHGAPSETPANTISKLYLDDEAYEHVPRKITLETSSVDPESIVEDDLDVEEDNSLRAEITSPPGNVATVSSERLVTHVASQHLLPPLAPEHSGRKCLVLDLDETLVHSSFREVEHPDYVVPVVLEGQEHNVYVVKRPGVDEFMRIMGEYYEIVVFTASLSMYADPVLDLLDKSKVVHHRLFRESCNLYNGNYVKDLSRLGRDIADSIIIDNSPASYAFHPNNAIGISTWLNDPMDTELRDLIPFLIDLTQVDDVAAVLSLTHNHASFE
ncbi:hypothetical protein GGI15_001476 [Coemansia interrupta]|uniref:protein-serine/threonine phosphatase n=1 Tax=Coemansia interrupta TaxID=1126814 RepID=A0A9W8HJY5_9FUNG|nr:hypothetical protein GGI15_001476 [Coemansia interrupta]